MYVVTMISGPNAPALDPVLVENLRLAWGGDIIGWLNPGKAAEFAVEQVPDNFSQVHSDLDEMSIDIVIQPGTDRRKAMLIADMDSTMIQQECIDELADAAGFGAQVARITALAMDGKLDFEQALTERVLVLKGLEMSVIDTVLANQITLTPGGSVLIKTMKSNGAYCALVSGGFTAFAEPVAKMLRFDESRANILLEKDGVLTGEVATPILGRDAKVAALSEICSRIGIVSAQAIAVGDGANDLGMLGAAGAGVALHAKPSVAAECDIQINHGDLTSLLYLQGYNRDEFVD